MNPAAGAPRYFVPPAEDVYKRQARPCSIRCRCPCRASWLSTPAPCSPSRCRSGRGRLYKQQQQLHITLDRSQQELSAVSYTHLDVYKRQVPDFTFMENELTNRKDEFNKTVISMHARPYTDVFNDNVVKMFQHYVIQYPGIQFCTAAHTCLLYTSISRRFPNNIR